MPTFAPSETPAAELRGRKGSSFQAARTAFTKPAAPRIDPAILSSDSAVLGICYGQQLMAYELGGRVRKGDKGEYGLALLDARKAASRCSPI